MFLPCRKILIKPFKSWRDNQHVWTRENNSPLTSISVVVLFRSYVTPFAFVLYLDGNLLKMESSIIILQRHAVGTFTFIICLEIVLLFQFWQGKALHQIFWNLLCSSLFHEIWANYTHLMFTDTGELFWTGKSVFAMLFPREKAVQLVWFQFNCTIRVNL